MTLINKLDVFDEYSKKEVTPIQNALGKVLKAKKIVILESDEPVKANNKFGQNLLKYGTVLLTTELSNQKFIATKNKRQKNEKVELDEGWIQDGFDIEKLKFELMNSKHATTSASLDEIKELSLSADEFMFYGTALDITHYIINGRNTTNDTEAVLEAFSNNNVKCYHFNSTVSTLLESTSQQINLEDWQLKLKEICSIPGKKAIAISPMDIFGVNRAQRIEILEYLAEYINDISFIIYTDKKLTGSDEFSKYFKKWNVGIISTNINEQNVLKVYNSKFKNQEQEYEDNIRYIIGGKSIKKVKVSENVK